MKEMDFFTSLNDLELQQRKFQKTDTDGVVGQSKTSFFLNVQL